MVEGKKISELGLVTNINDGCCFPLLSNGATKRITFAVLLENILNHLTIPENQEIKVLKEKVNNLDSSIELTDKEIEEIKNRCIELQKEIDSQDEIVIKYIKLFEELKEAYDKIEAEGMIIDDELDESSEHAIANKTVAKLIPEQANEENQLADKNFVNSSIATNTAYFIGTFESYTDLLNTDKTLTNNDYAFVHNLDENGNAQYDRYKWNGSEWKFEYTLNNSSFTSEQWEAINSGITKQSIEEITKKLHYVRNLTTRDISNSTIKNIMLDNISNLPVGISVLEVAKQGSEFQTIGYLVSKASNTYFSYISTSFYASAMSNGRYSNGEWI